MKKFLLAVLALGAMTMVACNPDNNGPAPDPEPTADYTFSAAAFTETQSLLTPYGDYYENGTSNYYLELAGVVMDEEGTPLAVHMLALDYTLPADVTDGLGTVSADVDGSMSANSYFPGYVQDGYLMGSGAMVMDYTTYEITNYCFKSGDVTISAKDGVYTVKGFVTCDDGKVVKIDYVGEVLFNDEENGGVAPLKACLKLAK